jgi:hypothetical protein
LQVRLERVARGPSKEKRLGQLFLRLIHLADVADLLDEVAESRVDEVLLQLGST